MNSLIIAVICCALYFIAYKTYGRFIARKIFDIDPDKKCPSVELEDGVDYVPTKKEVLFGHHFASIAGAGPIVGPAIAVIWGWVPALIWVVFGTIFIGAVHDFGALIVSMRNRGRSIGDLAGNLVNNRVRTLFLLIIFFALWIVVAIFGVVIAVVFKIYPHSVIPIWLQIPIAIILGWFISKKGVNPYIASIIAVAVLYGTIALGAYAPDLLAITKPVGPIKPIGIWVIILLVYAYIASVLPVQVLLQPRDFMNAYQLLVALVLLALGVIVAHPKVVAPSVDWNPPGAPPMFPMLFIVIACGAISGFHSLVSSGTTAKQCDNERSAQFVGYGGMLMEGVLALFVIIACTAGIGIAYKSAKTGLLHTGVEAFSVHYGSWGGNDSLGNKISAFIQGSTNMIQSVGIPLKIALAIMGVFVAAFAATTLDTATRIQRYIVGELAQAFKIPWLSKKHPATFIAVATALVLAFFDGTGSGTGAMILWPLFGCTNQLLAGLALLIVTIYLAKNKKPIIYTLIPMIIMIVMNVWATIVTMKGFYLAKNKVSGLPEPNYFLLVIAAVIMILEIWMIVESAIVVKKSYA